MIRGDDLRRFWSKTRRDGACIVWTGAIGHYGYGKFMIGPRGKQKTYLAHRWIYERTVGSINGPVLRHRCDNPACVNIKHLVPGSQRDNVHDAMRRGRRPSVGVRRVRQIKAAYARGESVSSIARKIAVPYHTVYGIAAGTNWSHV